MVGNDGPSRFGDDHWVWDGLVIHDLFDDVDYVGASAVELIGSGESAGSYAEILIKGGKNTTVGYR